MAWRGARARGVLTRRGIAALLQKFCLNSESCGPSHAVPWHRPLRVRILPSPAQATQAFGFNGALPVCACAKPIWSGLQKSVLQVNHHTSQ